MACPPPPDASPSSAHPPAPGMAWIPAGAFTMGSARFYPEEAPVREVAVEGFWIDRAPVTVADFARFVDATDHVTEAERAPDPSMFPGADPAVLVPGALVFHPTAGPVELDDLRRWWSWVPGAQWRHPEGPGSDVAGRGDHPVTQVSYDDAAAYARWAGKALPTEAEWERAARGGLEQATYTWGEGARPGGEVMANTWQGEFPWQNLLLDGYERTSPVGAFPPNGFGLHDMAGNVWEWTSDRFATDRSRAEVPSCCTPGGRAPTSGDEPGDAPGTEPSMRTIKGGSHLCAPNYCFRYRPAARQSQSTDSSTGHLGFRCIVRPEAPLPR